jgi:magnesium transporter
MRPTTVWVIFGIDFSCLWDITSFFYFLIIFPMVHQIKDGVVHLALDIKNDLFERLQERIHDLDVHDILDLFDISTSRARLLIFRLLDQEVAADVFAELSPHAQQELLQHFTDKEVLSILDELQPDERTYVFEHIPGKATQRLLNLLPADELIEAKKLLWFPEESVGRLMTPRYLALKSERTAAQALEKVRYRGMDTETINVLYVINHDWELIGVLSIRDLVLADPQSLIGDIMIENIYQLLPTDDRETAVHLMQKSGLVVLPVVDARHVLIGIVTADDVLDVASEETTEDFHIWAAISPLRRDYNDTSIVQLVMKRLPWLLVLVGVNLASSWVISAFEHTLASALALAFFIPLLIGSGGNAWAQSATLMVRALATGDVKMHQRWRAFSKEIMVGIILWIIMGFASGVVWVFRGWFEVSLVVGVSMVAIVIFANSVGVVLPFILTKMKQDPAVAWWPLITSLVDAGGLLIYFSLATLIIL